MINVTKTFLPNIDKYKSYIDEIYKNGWITNSGPLLERLEKKLSEYLGVKNLILVSNGTLALEIAYRALGLRGDVITTPFSFVATTSSLVTNNISPVFSDIDKKTLNLDPNKFESLITKNTKAILPVHVFGNACEIDKISEVAKSYNLKVIYDAAHAFDVSYKGKSILNYGDISTISFHATKLFHTIEGGALIVNDDSLVDKIRYLINFGIKDLEEIPELGINAKMNEFSAAMGLCMLDEMEEIKEKRKIIYLRYREMLSSKLIFQELNENSSMNYSYFPIIFRNEKELKTIQNLLNQEDIYPRRYFYPSLDTLSYIEPKQSMPISRDISSRIMCLPLYYGLEEEVQLKIIKLINHNL